LPQPSIPFRTSIICAALLLLFAGCSFFAANRCCATSDEPLHAVAADVILHRHDFRVNPEDPPLWQYWCALPQSMDAIHADFDSPAWKSLLHDMLGQFAWARDAMYSAPGADDFLRRSRAMMLIVSVALGVLLARTAWQLGGAVAAITATVLFCFDPNLMAHAALVKNDIAFSLAMFAFAIKAWRLGQRITLLRVTALCLAMAAGLTTKFSGVLLPGMLVILLASRTLLREAWPMGRRIITTAAGRAGAAAGILVIAIVFAFVAIWVVYGFRFSPSPKEGEQFNTNYFRTALAINQQMSQHPDRPATEDEIIEQIRHPGMAARTVLFANAHRLLPQSWLLGFLYTYAGSIFRPGYLLGEIRTTGWWYYFPLAFLFKSPLSTIAIVTLGGVVVIRRASSLYLAARAQHRGFDQSWTLIAFSIPFIIYLASAVTSHLNIGLRHIFPLYPFMFLGAGVGIAKLRRQIAQRTILILAILLCIETATGYPDLIAYFNLPARAYGRLRLLGDSNLDWGQNLTQLAQWQAQHSDTSLYLDYFGTAPPIYYGIIARPMPEIFRNPGVVAISAMSLQGIYSAPDQRQRYATFRRQRPLANLGGSIYLYTVPLPQNLEQR
jgi:hypothetical protein